MSAFAINTATARRLVRSLALAALAVLLPEQAHTAVSTCTVTASSVAFGTYTPLQATALASTGTIGITCTVTSHRNTVTVAITAGHSGSFTTRNMTTTVGTTTYTLLYNLYQNANDTTIWGDGTGGSSTEAVTLTRTRGATSVSVNETVYGAIPALQDPAPGNYADTITVSVSY